MVIQRKFETKLKLTRWSAKLVTSALPCKAARDLEKYVDVLPVQVKRGQTECFDFNAYEEREDVAMQGECAATFHCRCVVVCALVTRVVARACVGGIVLLWGTVSCMLRCLQSLRRSIIDVLFDFS